MAAYLDRSIHIVDISFSKNRVSVAALSDSFVIKGSLFGKSEGDSGERATMDSVCVLYPDVGM